MSPRSADSNAAQSKQKKKNNDSPPANSLPSEQALVTSASDSAPLQPELQHVAPTPIIHDVGLSPPLAPSTSSPRVFVASTLKPASAIDAVTSTISAISQQANRGISNLIAAHSTAPTPSSPLVGPSAALGSNGSVSPIFDAFHNAGSTPDPARVEAALQHAHEQEQPSPPLSPTVLWSRWDRLPLKAHPLKWAPLLISYFQDGTLQVLLVQGRQISELLSLPNAADVLQDRASSSQPPRSQLLTALVRHPIPTSAHPQLLLVLQEPDSATHLYAYSLAAHQVQASVQLRHHPVSSPVPTGHTQDRSNVLWQQVESQCNERFLVLSFASPASIHVLSTSTLEYSHPPVVDLSAVSSERPPPISLSHRLLAFTCDGSRDVSPIRSDTRKISNAAYHDTTRHYTGGQTDASGRVGEMRDNLFETSAQVGDAARRIRGGVMSGVRTLGEWGSSYWPPAGSPPATAAFSPPQPSLLSQSAPHTAHSPRFSASVSPLLLASDGSRSTKRLSTGEAPVVSAKPAAEASTHANTNAARAGCVRIIDLGSSDARTICTFTPTGNAVTMVALSPCGRMILTADDLGHAFHVFELNNVGTFGYTGSPASAAVLHRYKLMRGITTADVVRAEWSHDAQWVTVGTRSGTVHVYAVNPFGGVPSIANHIQGKVKNPRVLQPYSVSLASVARSIRPSPPVQHDAQHKPANVGSGAETGAATATTAQTRSAPPSFLMIGSANRTSDTAGETSSPFELLTIDPRSISVTLHAVRCWSTQARPSPLTSHSSEEVHATSPNSTQRLAAATSPRSSGLSQMMRKAGEGLLHGQQAPRLQAECVRVALWEQLMPDTRATNKQNVSTLLDQPNASLAVDRAENASLKPVNTVAKAEIETYSQSPAILPASIFLSRQTFFHARTRSSSKQTLSQTGSTKAASESFRCVQRRGSRPIQVRRTARIVSREPSSEESSSFDDSLAGALDQMSFDPHTMPPRSASAHIPSFPQGQRGRSSGWTSGSSIPIRIVAGGLGGIYRAGKELGRGVEMARRRTSGATNPEANGAYSASASASVSFDGVDEVDLLGEDDGSARSGQRHHSRVKEVGSHPDPGSVRSDTSNLSALRNDEPSRGSQPSSAETPSTRFSEAEDLPSADADECDWDAIEASRSPAAPAAPLFDAVEEASPASAAPVDSLDDDFTVGMLDEDSSRLSLPPSSNAPKSAAKELVYALPAAGSTRSSLLSQSSGLTTMESRAGAKDRDSSPPNSDGGESGSQASAASGLLCEGGKETHRLGEAESEGKESKDVDVKPAQVPVISTSGGGGKKKKKKGGR